MSKVISFSISDRYLDKLRSLYPALTDNLAAKQFITDGLDSNLGSSLDDGLDDSLDERTKTLIESWVDGLLEVRLDAVVGKLITSLSERLSRLEERLDDNVDGRLDAMEQLLKRDSLDNSPALEAIKTVPTVEDATVKDEDVEPDSTIWRISDALETLTGDNSPMNDADRPAIEKTQSEIARLLGVHNSTVTRWKQNKAIPSEYSDKCRFNSDKTKILWIN